MGFEVVPNEIARMIFLYLASRDLSAVSSSCRNLNIKVEPMLYSTLGTQQTTRKVVPLLIRTILEKPQLGSWFKNIKLWHPSFRQTERKEILFKGQFDASCFLAYQPEIMTHLKQYIGDGEGREAFEIHATHSPRDVVKYWFASIFRLSNFDSFVALLISLVPNLRHLVFEGYPQCDSRGLSYTHRVLSTASKLQRNGPTADARFSLSQLKDLSMVYRRHDQLEMDYLIPLFRMPSLRTLSCNGCELDYSCLLSCLSSIQNLALLNFTYDRSSQIRSILAMFNKLETMTIQIGHGNNNSDFSTIIDSIAHSQSTLQKLKITEERQVIEQKRSIPSFALFKKLRTLDLEWHFLEGYGMATGRRFGLADLPPTLEKLVFRTTPREWMLGYLRNNVRQLGVVPKLARIDIRSDGSDWWRIEWSLWGQQVGEDEILEWRKIIEEYQKNGCILSLPEDFGRVLSPAVTAPELVSDSEDDELFGFKGT